MAAPGRLLNQTQVGIFRCVDRFLDESQFLDLFDTFLNDLKIRLAVEIAVEVLFSEQPVFQQRRRSLQEARDNLHRLLVVVHKHGGKYLSRSGNVKTLEGKPLDTTFKALLQFPSAEAAQAFATDPRYAPYAAARQAGSESRFQLIDNTDVAGTIPYLPKG